MPQFIFLIDPVAASRVRVGRFTSYYKGPYAEFRKNSGSIIDKVLKKTKASSKALEVFFSFFAERPAKTKLRYPMPDWDNYGKAISDALNKKLWKDDRQIVDAHTSKRWVGQPSLFDPAQPEPCIVVTVREVGEFEEPGKRRTDDDEEALPKLPSKRRRSARKQPRRVRRR